MSDNSTLNKKVKVNLLKNVNFFFLLEKYKSCEFNSFKSREKKKSRKYKKNISYELVQIREEQINRPFFVVTI